MKKIEKTVSHPANEQAGTHLKDKENPATGSPELDLRFAFNNGHRYVLFNGKAYSFENDFDLHCALTGCVAGESCEAVEASLAYKGNLLTETVFPSHWLTFEEALTRSIDIHNDEIHRDAFGEAPRLGSVSSLLLGTVIANMEDGLSLAIRDELASNAQKTLDSEDLFSRFVGECGAETFATFCKSAQAAIAVCRHFFDLHCEEYLARYRNAA